MILQIMFLYWIYAQYLSFRNVVKWIELMNAVHSCNVNSNNRSAIDLSVLVILARDKLCTYK